MGHGAQPVAVAPASSPPPPKSSRSDDGVPRSSGGSPQYVVHRPREAPRQLMGLSSSTLETAVQRDSSAYAHVPSWSADSDRRISSAPPPLPRASLDDYEELDAEPEEDSSGEARPWSDSDGQSDPPPLPGAHAFGEDDGDEMRAEQPTVVIPPPEERQPDARRAVATGVRDGLGGESPRDASNSWELDGRSSTWESGSWDDGTRSSGEGASTTSLSEPAPAKLTARVHHQAVRVSVAPDPRGSGQFVVRPLREGERAAPGERVALLVALEPGLPLV
jgi:hypothetical protein